jgi:hypothetical protein
MITAVETPNAIRWRQALLTDRDRTLEYLYTRTWPVVRQYVKQQQGTEEDAKDVLQDSMIIFFEKVVHDQLVLTAAPVTYLVAISKPTGREVPRHTGAILLLRAEVGENRPRARLPQHPVGYRSEVQMSGAAAEKSGSLIYWRLSITNVCVPNLKRSNCWKATSKAV